MVRVEFLGFFLPGENDFLCVHHDDEVAYVRVRRVRRFGLAPQCRSDDGRESPQSLAFRVNEVPPFPDVQIRQFGRPRSPFHIIAPSHRRPEACRSIVV